MGEPPPWNMGPNLKFFFGYQVAGHFFRMLLQTMFGLTV